VDRPDPAVQALCDYHRETDPEKLVLRLCRDLLARVRTTGGPSNLQVLGSIRGVRQCHVAPISPASGCSGFLIPRDGGYEITVNAAEPPERQNFSIAHEIVHSFFRDVWPRGHPSAAEEILCDLGAAELTMPLSRFRARLKIYGLTLDAVTTTNQPACLLIATMSRTKKQQRLGSGTPALRIAKWWSSSRWPDKTSYTNRPVAHGSPISQAFAQLDQRQATAKLNLSLHNQVCWIQARGYAYPLPGNADHRQVVALALPVSEWSIQDPPIAAG
jgi:hypothetical protein